MVFIQEQEIQAIDTFSDKIGMMEYCSELKQESHNVIMKKVNADKSG
ncbi:MAG: hypothetical protein ACSLEL_05580 [Candidatus Malihini olakiniferum]